MKGQFFAFIEKTQEGINVRTGVVKQQVGVDRWLLEFQAKNYRFSNVFSSESLERFAFFNTQAEQQAFIAELAASQAPPPAPAPAIIDVQE